MKSFNANLLITVTEAGSEISDIFEQSKANSSITFIVDGIEILINLQ